MTLSAVLPSDTSAVLRPSLHVGPVPCGSAADRPAGFGETSPSCSPGVHGASGDAQAGGDLDGANGVTCHEESVGKVLTVGKGCGHNTYMTTTQTAANFQPFQGSTARSDALLICAGWLQRNNLGSFDSWLDHEVNNLIDLYLARGEGALWSIFE